MKFHCKQSLSLCKAPYPPQGWGDGDAHEYRGDREWHPRISAPASASSSLLPPCASNKGASVPVPPASTAAAKTLPWSRNPPERSRGSRGHWTQPRRPYFGAGAEPGCRNEQKVRGKNKESLPAITGFSNMANHAIFTGAYLFSEDAGTDSRVSFFSPAVFKDRFELALFKGFASCPLFLTPCTSLCVPPLLKTKQTPEKTQQQQKKHQNHTPTAVRTQTYKGPLGSRKQSSFQAILLKP